MTHDARGAVYVGTVRHLAQLPEAQRLELGELRLGTVHDSDLRRVLALAASLPKVHSLRVDTRSERIGALVAALPALTYLRLKCPLSVLEEAGAPLRRPSLRVKLVPVFADHALSHPETRALVALCPGAVLVEPGLTLQQELRLLETIRPTVDSLSGALSGAPTLLTGEWPRLEQLEVTVRPPTQHLMKVPGPALKRLSVESDGVLPARFLDRCERLKAVEALALRASQFEPGLLVPLPFLSSPLSRLRLHARGPLGVEGLLGAPWWPGLTHLALEGQCGVGLEALVGRLAQLKLLELDVEHPPLAVLEALAAGGHEGLLSLEVGACDDDAALARWLAGPAAVNLRYLRGPRLGPAAVEALCAGHAPRLSAFELSAEGVGALEALAGSHRAREVTSLKVWASLTERTSALLNDRARFPFLKDVRVSLPGEPKGP